MGKYIKKFKSWDEAKASNDLWSPNLSGLYTSEGTKMFCKSAGEGVKFKFVGDSMEDFNYAALHNVTNNLTHVTTSNPAPQASQADKYETTLTVDDGYENMTVSVKMNGSDITSTAYSEGKVTIDSVTGPIVITAEATAIPGYENMYILAITDTAVQFNDYTDSLTRMLLETSTDDTNWAAYTDGAVINIPAGSKLYWRAQDDNSACVKRDEGTHHFTITGSVKLYGNPNSLIKKKNYVNVDVPNSMFEGMFQLNTSIIEANLLFTSTNVGVKAYASMFDSCTNMTIGPTSLAATTLGNYCYIAMFGKCSALTNAPVISATTLAFGCCMSMFHSCTALTTAPDLLVETLPQSCCQDMFYNCSNLHYIKCLATNAGEPTARWVGGVSSTGTFVKKAGSTWPTSMSGIPEGWTVQEV